MCERQTEKFVSNNDFPKIGSGVEKQGSEGVKDSKKGREKERESERKREREMRRWRVRAAEAGRQWEQLECDREEDSRHRRATGTLTLTGGFEVKREGRQRREQGERETEEGELRWGEGGLVHSVAPTPG